jgi:hypothetical protein
VFESRDVTINKGIGQTSRITIEVGPPPIHSTDPLEETVEEGVSSEKEDTPEQIEPEHAPSPPPQLVEPIPCRSNHTRRAPIQDDNERFECTSYSKNTTNSVGEATTARVNRADISDEPPTYKATMSSPEAAQWQIACTEELQSLQDMKVYEEVPRPPDCKIIDSRWTFKLKRGPEGLIEIFKGRVVAKGYTQVEGLDYDETFVPVVKFTSIRTLLALAAHLDLEIHQVNIKTAFLNGKLDKKIYLRPPPCADTDKSLIWRLHRPLYGLKQSSRQWYQEVYMKFTTLRHSKGNYQMLFPYPTSVKPIGSSTWR